MPCNATFNILALTEQCCCCTRTHTQLKHAFCNVVPKVWRSFKMYSAKTHISHKMKSGLYARALSSWSLEFYWMVLFKIHPKPNPIQFDHRFSSVGLFICLFVFTNLPEHSLTFIHSVRDLSKIGNLSLRFLANRTIWFFPVYSPFLFSSLSLCRNVWRA